MTSTVATDRAQRRINDFKKQCGDDGDAALHLAYHAALPVALNAELLHLLRINFFLDPPEVLPYTVEFEFLLSPLCREIDEGLYEVEPDIRTLLLTGLTETYETERIQDIATLLWQYVEHQAPWGDRIELERAQQLTALNFLDPDKAREWLDTVETSVGQGQVAAREWLVAIRQEIENQGQHAVQSAAAAALEQLGHDGRSADESETKIAQSSQEQVQFSQEQSQSERSSVSGTVLWVDDHPENNTSERLSLEASGVRFVLAISTGEALEIMQGQTFDLIISDMGRSLDPQASYTLIERLRAGGDRTPVIIYSSSRYSSNVAEAQARGAIGVTGSPTVLMSMVLAALRNSGRGGVNEQAQAMSGTSAIPPQQFVETPQPIETEVKPIEVFISYSHRDAELRDELVTHLALLKRQGLIQVWTDREITGGSEWVTEINTSIERADLILILVSANLLASDYAWGEEMQRAIARHEAGEAQVIPIILKPVDWIGSPFGKLQVLPRNTEPITSWANQDEAFLDVARGIRAAVERIRVRRNSTSEDIYSRTTNLTPEERFKQQVREMMRSRECSIDEAIFQVLPRFSDLANQAVKLQDLKHQIEWELRFRKD
jgi:CheY-like chemotaxis protein